MDIQELVTEFHEKYNLSVNFTDDEIIYEDAGDGVFATELDYRQDLITEEFHETLEAFDELYNVLNETNLDEEEYVNVHKHLLKELCDLVYVCVGTAISFGYDFDTAFRRVHESNMTKTGGIVSGKLTKGENYNPPVLDNYVYIYKD